MASSKEYLAYILEQLSGLQGLRCRPMMGEYLLYYRDRVIGGVYDDRFLVKITPSSLRLMPRAEREIPYPGGKEMLLVDNPEDREFLSRLFEEMDEELPAPKRKS